MGGIRLSSLSEQKEQEIRAKFKEIETSLKIAKSEIELLQHELESTQCERDKWRTKHNLLFEYLYIGK